ncbi:MAG: UDP-N-acetylglucosamine--N-acetylmuramyl-(pentapeptide) pyrophosphoryl-undecaprenol N-acetylglucosamine transferase [Candidatus Levyibacteriota bacterium]
MKVLIAVGGGGHFSPALAVIKEMPKDWDVLLVGRKHAFEGDQALSLEYQTAQRLHLAFEALTTGRLQRKFSGRSLLSILKIPAGFAQANMILLRYKPDVVLSFGGYVAVPVVVAAATQRIPVVIHEQTLHAGLANKISAKFATKICLSWPESARYFPKEKIVFTGNPLRKEFLVPAKVPSQKQANSDKLLYITGGSGGAHGINVLIAGCLEKLLEKYTIIHQTGDSKRYSDFDHLKDRRSQLPEHLQKKYVLKKFIDSEDVIHVLSQADLVIARSGINTVTELLYLGKPSLFIPLPYGQQNEQAANAAFVKKNGLAEIVNQSTASSERLLETINNMTEHLGNYTKHALDARQLIHTDAAENILKEVAYAKEKKSTT